MSGFHLGQNWSWLADALPEQNVFVVAAAVLKLQHSCLQDAVALLRCDERPGAPAISILTRLLRNIVNSPQEAKYRRLRLQNPKIKDAVVEIAGGIELLQVRRLQVLPGGPWLTLRAPRQRQHHRMDTLSAAYGSSESLNCVVDC